MLVLIKQKLIYAKRQNFILSWDGIPKEISAFYNLLKQNTETERIAISLLHTSFLSARNSYTLQPVYGKKNNPIQVSRQSFMAHCGNFGGGQ